MNQILLVDINLESLNSLKKSLVKTNSEFEIQVASSVEECISKVFKFHPQVILISYANSVKLSLSICKILKSNKLMPYIPIIIIGSATTTTSTKLQFFKCGADIFINHPADSYEIGAQIEAILRLSEFEKWHQNKEYDQLKDTILRLHEVSSKIDDLELFGKEIWRLFKNISSASAFYFGIYIPLDDVLQLVFQDNLDFDERFSAKNSPICPSLINRKPVQLKPSDLTKSGSSNMINFCKTDCYWLGIPLINNDNLLGILGFAKKTNQGIFDNYEIERLSLLIQTVSAILDSKLISLELLKTLEKSIQSEKLKDNFLSNISHEIRTPLNSIIGFSSMLYDDVSDKEKHEYLDVIIDGGQSLMKIIDDIVDIAKIQSGEISINSLDTNIVSLMRDLKNRFDGQIEFKTLPIKLNLDIPPNIDSLVIKTDPHRLSQILENLLLNAIKFTYKGDITFGFEIQNSESIKFYVKDTGIGIPKDKLDSIFDRFVQIETGHTRDFGGNGIGLSITKSLVILLNGNIEVESEVGKGSLFSFSIPIDYQKFVPSKDKKYSYRWHGKNILIVDDISANLEFLEILLKKTGANTFLATNGQKAIDIISKKNNIDLVIMDLQMPIMDGYQATRIIKTKFPNIKVIVQTAYSERSDRHKAFEAGCDDYLEKPIKADNLLEIIDKYL